MFENQVAYYLNRYLGTYVYGVDPQSLKISVLKGDVVLHNLRLKPEALTDLNLPITVKAGLLGTLTLKVPWANLGGSSVIVEIDRLYILAKPGETDASKQPSTVAELRDGELKLKEKRVRDAETAWLQAREKAAAKAGEEAGAGGGMFRGLIDTIIGNLQMNITNIHIRYEDAVSYKAAPFAVGLTLEGLNAFTIDELGRETFVTHNPLQLLRKASQLRRLALYFDVGTQLWGERTAADWQAMSREDWDRLFKAGIAESAPSSPSGPSGPSSPSAKEPGAAPKPGAGLQRNYVLKPVDGRLRYLRRGRDARKTEKEAVQEADLDLETISLHISRPQYLSLQSLLEAFNNYSARAASWQLRPGIRPASGEGAALWWQYAVAAVRARQQGLSWSTARLLQAVKLRSKYIARYKRCLEDGTCGADEEIKDMDRQLNESTILVFRHIAYLEMEAARKEAGSAEVAAKPAKRTWVGWMMGEAAPGKGKAAEEGEGEGQLRSDLTPEEVAQLQEMAAEQQDALQSGKQSPYSLLTQVNIGVYSASVVLDGPTDSAEVLRAGLEKLAVGLDMYPGSSVVKVGVASMGVRSPEGNLVRTGARLQSSKSGEPPASASPASWDAAASVRRQGSAAGSQVASGIQALEVEYVQKPQDGSADAVLHMALAPSYVTYHRRTIDRVTHFFHTEKELDLSALGAQAVAQVERAQRAAREQLAAALNRKPRLVLRLQLDAPKIAIPVPASEGEGRLTLVADLGTFLIESDAEAAKKLSAEEAGLYQCARVTLRDISAYVVDGDFSFRALERAGADLCPASSPGDTPRSPVTEAISFAVRDADGLALGGAARFIPLLERTGAESSVQIARLAHPTLPSIRLQLSIPKLRFFYSPARVRRCLRVMRAAAPAAAADTKGAKPKQEVAARPSWRANAEYSGRLRLLEWGGIGRITASWVPRWAVLYRGRLYLYDGPNSNKPLQTCTFWNRRRICSIPEEAVGGTPHVLAIMPPSSDTAKVAETKGCLVLRLNSEAEAREWKIRLRRSQEAMQEVSGGSRLAADFGEESSSDEEDEEDASAEPDLATGGPKPADISINAELGELALFVSGRTPDSWWPPQEGAEGGESAAGVASSGAAQGPVDVDGEKGLVVIRAMSGSTSVSLATGHMSTHFGIGAFEIEDLLVGPPCPAHRYLGRSFLASDGLELDDVDVEFFDVEAEPSSPMLSASSGTLDSGPIPAVSSSQKTAWAVVLETWSPGHPGYRGVDSELRMTLTTLYFFCNRPTIGALIGVGIDTGAAFSSAPAVPPAPPPTSEPTPRPTGELEATKSGENGHVVAAALTAAPDPVADSADMEGGKLVKEGGERRVIFRLQVDVEKLEVEFNYESATVPPLGTAYVERVTFCLGVHPTSIVIDASLGNMKAVDGALPEGHPYRNVIGLRSGASTSLIQVALASHVADTGPAGNRIPSGLAYWTLNAQMRELEIFYLNRFLQEILRYIFLMLRLQPEYAPKPASPMARQTLSQPAASAPTEQGAAAPPPSNPAQAAAPPFLMLLDISMEAPVIILPRNSDSNDSLEVDLGKLTLSNRVLCLGPALPTSPQAVLQDDMTIQLSDLGMRVITAGVPADNLVRDYDAGLQVLYQRPLRDPLARLPTTQVRVSIPSITMAYSDREYHFTISVTGDNFAEPLRIPEPALWLEHVHMPEPPDTTEKQAEAAAQALLHVEPEEARSRSPERDPPGAAASNLKDAEKVSTHVVVEVGKLELAMFQSMDQAGSTVVPLASFAIGKLWVSYRSCRGGSMALRISIPRVECLDRRPWVPRDHSRVISSELTSGASASTPRPGGGETGSDERPAPVSFLVLEYRADSSSSSLQLRLQRPTISVEMSLMIAITKFYVPSFFLTGVAPIPFHSEDILLTDAEYHAPGDVWLCPETRILADTPGVDDYVYDGKGHRIILPEGISGEEGLPLIMVGPAKTLHLRDVKIVHAASLSACLQLAAGAQLFAHPADNVYRLEGADSEVEALSPSPVGRSPSRSLSWGSRTLSRRASTLSSAVRGPRTSGSSTIPEEGPGMPARSLSRSGADGEKGGGEASSPSRFSLEIVAVGMGLRFMELDGPDSAKAAPSAGEAGCKGLEVTSSGMERDPGDREKEGQSPRSVRMLAAYLDLTVSYVSEAAGQQTKCQLRGLRVETQTSLAGQGPGPPPSQVVGRSEGRVQATVLEPCKVAVEMGKAGGSAGDVTLSVSDIRLNLSPDVLELLLALQASVLQPLIHPSPDKPLARCSQFVSVWNSRDNVYGPAGEVAEPRVLGTFEGLTFWHPQAPTGYAPLGDCITRGDRQPTFQVVTVAVNSGLVMFPEGFDRVCGGGGVTVWMPRPPHDYVSLGCIATSGDSPPPNTSVACIHHKAVVEAPLGPCLLFRPSPGPPRGEAGSGRASADVASSSGDAGAEEGLIAALWCIDNCAATFLSCTPQQGTPPGPYLELRSPLGITPAGLAKRAATAPPPPATPPPSVGNPRSETPSRASSMSGPSRAMAVPIQSPHGRSPLPRTSPSSKGSSLPSVQSPETLRLGQSPRGGRSHEPRGLHPQESLGQIGGTLAGYNMYHRFVEERARQLAGASRRGLRSSTADFRRLWWDKHARNPSRLGVSLWRPQPPPGYVALGDCLESGYDPPQSVLVLRDSDIGGSPGVGDDFPPLLKPPSAYQLVWRDESCRQERALTIWYPIPYPGYVAMGHVANIGVDPPKRMLVRCVRADSVEKADLHAIRAAARLPGVGRRTPIALWRADERLDTFLVTPANAAPAANELWRICLPDPAATSSSATSSSSAPPDQAGMSVVLRLGAAQLLVRDALRRPLAQLELGEVDAGLQRRGASVMQAHLGLRVCAWTYNAVITAWEPLIEPWDLILKLESNSSPFPSCGVNPGTHVTVKSTSELVHATLAYAAVSSLLDAVQDWRDLHSAGGGEAYRRQLAAADAASVHTVVHNRLGVAAELQLDFGDRTAAVMLEPDQATAVLQPLPKPPLRSSDRLRIPVDALPPPLLGVEVHTLTWPPLSPAPAAVSRSGPRREAGRRAALYVVLSLGVLSNPASPDDLDLACSASDVRTRAVEGSVEETGGATVYSWRERLILDFDPSNIEGKARLTLAVWDDLAKLGEKVPVAVFYAELEPALWKQSGSRLLTLTGRTASPASPQQDNLELEVRLKVARPPIVKAPEVTDAWAATGCTSGQRAIRIGNSETYCSVPPSGLQHALGAGAARETRFDAEGGPTSAVVTPVRMSEALGIAFESSFRDGVKVEIMRSLCQVQNMTPLQMEVGLKEAPPLSGRSLPPTPDGTSVTSRRRLGGSGEFPVVIEEQVFENQRYVPLRGWGGRGYLLPLERRQFSLTADGSQSFNDFPSLSLPDGWEWEGPWEVDKGPNVDAEGWAYAPDFGSMAWPPPPGSDRKGVVDFVRRRRLVRCRRHSLAPAPPQPGGSRRASLAGSDGSEERDLPAASASGAGVRSLGVLASGGLLPLPYDWQTCGMQVVVRPVIAGAGDGHPHAWSVGASAGDHSLRLADVEDSTTRLVASLPPLSRRPSSLGAPKAGVEGLEEELAASVVWLSLSVEGVALTSDARHEPLTDWRILVSPPLVLYNQLPMAGTYMVWEQPKEGETLQLRQSGVVESGARAGVYAADTRRSLSLQFFPEGFEWAEGAPVALSDGFSSFKAGVGGRQTLPESFKVVRTGYRDTPQSIYLNRDLLVEAWQLQKNPDPCQAVAQGAALLVRVFVPLWVVNASTLPMAACVVSVGPPPRPVPSAETRGPVSGLLDASESLNLKVLDTDESLSSRSALAGSRQVGAGSVALLAYPLQQLEAFRERDKKHYYGIRLKVGESGWTEALNLDSRADLDQAQDFSVRPVLIRARMPSWGAVAEVVARLEVVGSSFERTMALRLEPYCVISNLTGIPLQLMQYRSPGAGDKGRRDGTASSSALLPRRPSAGALRPGYSTAATLAEAVPDWTTSVDLPIGASAQPVVWSTGSEERGLCVRFAPLAGDPGPPLWSQPIQVGEPTSSTNYIVLPVRDSSKDGAEGGPSAPAAAGAAEAAPTPGDQGPPGGLRPPAGAPPQRRSQRGQEGSLSPYLRKLTSRLPSSTPSLDPVHGSRVSRRVKIYTSLEGGLVMDEVEVVTLRYVSEIRSPGALHILLLSVSAEASLLLENRSGQPVRYRQASIAGLPFLPLPPFSAAGFAWQAADRFIKPEVELSDAYGSGAAAVRYNLEDPSSTGGEADISVRGGRSPTGAGLPRLSLAVGVELQVTVKDRETEVQGEMGTVALGPASILGRSWIPRVLSITPHKKGASTADLAVLEPRAPGCREAGVTSFHMTVSMGAAELSIVDHCVEELLVVTVLGFRLEHSARIGAASDFSRLSLNIQQLQVDDMMFGSRFPVLLCPMAEAGGAAEGEGGESLPLLHLTIVSQTGEPRGQVYYPYITFRTSGVLQMSVTEALVWKIVEMARVLNLAALSGDKKAAVATATDALIKVALISVGDFVAAVSFRGDQFARPAWAARLGMLAWLLDMANFENVPVRLHGFEMKDCDMFWSVFTRSILKEIQDQVMGVALSFLRNFGILSGASGVLGALSASVATLAADDPYDKARAARQQERNITGVGEGLAEGGEALGAAFYRGFTGLIAKPLEGAKRDGVGGFVKGMSKGIIGAVAQPVSGGLEFFSSAFEGIDASSSNLIGRQRNPKYLQRRRLPRAIGGDGRVHPLLRLEGAVLSDSQSRIEEVGQALLFRCEEAASGLDLLRGTRRATRYWSGSGDAYEEHMLLPDDRVALLTDRAILLVHAPGFPAINASYEGGGGPTLEADIPKSEVKWEAAWKDVLDLELRWSQTGSPFPDRVIVHRIGTFGGEEEQTLAYALRCFPNSMQATELKAVALKVKQKYAATGQDTPLWVRRTLEPQSGLPPQAMPPVMLSLEYRLIWHTFRKTPDAQLVSIWRPIAPFGYKPAGDVAVKGLDPPQHPVQVFREDGPRSAAGEKAGQSGHVAPKPITAPPRLYHLIWRDNGRLPVTMWEPIPPTGYRALGTLVLGALNASSAAQAVHYPEADLVVCIREDLCERAQLSEAAIWKWDPPALQVRGPSPCPSLLTAMCPEQATPSPLLAACLWPCLLPGTLNLQRLHNYDPRTWRCSMWQVQSAAGTFLAQRSLRGPPPDTALAAHVDAAT